MDPTLTRKRLQEKMEQIGMTPTRLARELRLAEGYFRDFLNEKKESISYDAAAQAADMFGVGVDWLLGRDEGLSATTAGCRWKVGDLVQKRTGYRFPGTVRSVFRIEDGGTEWRVVVRCDVPDVRGCLHIFNPDQLEPRS